LSSSLLPLPPPSTLFPYTTLFRSTFALSKGAPMIYFHIPFCKQACHYCDFHFSTSMQYKAELLDRMEVEVKLRADYLEDKSVERSEEHTSELQSRENLVCRLLLEK